MDQAEQLRNIIKAKNQLSRKPAARVITVTSGKGGVGKSNTAIVKISLYSATVLYESAMRFRSRYFVGKG